MRYDKDHINIKYSQNEIANKKLIERLVNQSNITKDDLVYDIGSGAGIISEALLNKGAVVTAIEKDPKLCYECKARFLKHDRFEVYLDDFLEWEFPLGQRFKVFSNIPFFHTAEIVNKLLFGNALPEDCYLVIQKEAAEKYSGVHRDTLTSLLIKPLFWVDIIYYFRRTDFRPVPSVDVVLLQFEKRQCQLIPAQYYGLYKDFVVFCREGASQTVKKAFGELFTYSQIKQISKLLGIEYQYNPANLNFAQYLSVFQLYFDHIIKNKLLIRGAEERLHRQQIHLTKIHRTRKRLEIR